VRPSERTAAAARLLIMEDFPVVREPKRVKANDLEPFRLNLI
jgi:hypothetical protein